MWPYVVTASDKVVWKNSLTLSFFIFLDSEVCKQRRTFPTNIIELSYILFLYQGCGLTKLPDKTQDTSFNLTFS